MGKTKGRTDTGMGRGDLYAEGRTELEEGGIGGTAFEGSQETGVGNEASREMVQAAELEGEKGLEGSAEDTTCRGGSGRGGGRGEHGIAGQRDTVVKPFHGVTDRGERDHWEEVIEGWADGGRQHTHGNVRITSIQGRERESTIHKHVDLILGTVKEKGVGANGDSSNDEPVTGRAQEGKGVVARGKGRARREKTMTFVGMTKNADRIGKPVEVSKETGEPVENGLPVTVSRGRNKDRGVVGDGANGKVSVGGGECAIDWMDTDVVANRAKDATHTGPVFTP
jgi:hypothetical protein